MFNIDYYAYEYRNWRWQVPERLNIATVCAHRWAADEDIAPKIAIHWEDEDGNTDSVTYAHLSELTHRFAHALHSLGIHPGDKVAVCLPQRIETAVSLLAAFQIGAVAVPLTVLFGPEALAYRLTHADCAVVICDDASLANVLAVRAELPGLRHVIACAGAGAGASSDAGAGADTAANQPDVLSWNELCAAGQPEAAVVATMADDAALIIYTSGTTGPPKGALIPHRAMLGNLSGFSYSHNRFPQPDDVFWSPADWAWTGGLWDALLPTLYYGQTIIGYRGRFDPEKAFS